MKQQTALTELIEIVSEMIINGSDYDLHTVRECAKKLLPKEKQQIIEAYNQDLYGGLGGNKKYENGEQYFKETFEKEDVDIREIKEKYEKD